MRSYYMMYCNNVFYTCTGLPELFGRLSLIGSHTPYLRLSFCTRHYGSVPVQVPRLHRQRHHREAPSQQQNLPEVRAPHRQDGAEPGNQGRADHGDCVQEGRGGGGQPALDKTKNTEDGELKDKQIHEGIRG